MLASPIEPDCVCVCVHIHLCICVCIVQVLYRCVYLCFHLACHDLVCCSALLDSCPVSSQGFSCPLLSILSQELGLQTHTISTRLGIHTEVPVLLGQGCYPPNCPPSSTGGEVMSQAALNENVPTVWGYTLKTRIKRKMTKETKNKNQVHGTQ